jgi:hypothetical protein
VVALCRLLHWTVGHAIGWSCVIAVVISAGIDAWKLFYMGIVRLESPLYARLFLPPSTIRTNSAAAWCWKSPARSPVLRWDGCCSVRGHRKNRRLTQVFRCLPVKSGSAECASYELLTCC